MAETPYGGGVAQVSPEATPPDDYQHIQANPEAFGGGAARGAQELGQGIEKAGQNLFDIKEFQGKINADYEGNNYRDGTDIILNGDPSKKTIGPDGKPSTDLGFLGLRGRDAADARDATLKQIRDLRNEGRKRLNSPQEQYVYDSQTRRIYGDAVARIGSHSEQQWKSWAGGVNGTGADQALRGIANKPDNAENIAHNAADLINFRVQQAQIQFGNDQKIISGVIASAKTEALTAQLNAVAVKDPARAMSMLEKNKNIAGTQYDELATKFRARAEQQEGIAAGDAAIAQSFAKPSVILPTAATNDAVKGAILKQESGNRSNISTSVDGAVGPGQIIPATFRQYAKPGEDIGNPEDNRKVSARIIDDYMQRYNGDATRVAVAYFSGPGNVAPAGSPTPWLRDATDGNGKSVSGYVNDVATRLGGSTPSSRKANAYQVVMTDPALQDKPAVQQHALARIRQVATDAQIAADATEKAQKEANDKAAGGYTTRMLNGDFTNIATQIANDPTLDWRTKSALHAAAEAASGSDVQKAAQSYGPGFWDAYKNISLPADDPKRIANITQLLQRAGPGGDLTLAGVEKLGQSLALSQKNVDGQAVNTSKTGLLNYAKSKLSFEADTGPIKIRDPKGEAIFNAQFIPKFEAAFDKWTKENKNAWEFLTKENVDKMIVGMRSQSEMAMDKMTATGEALPAEPANAPLPPTPDNVDPAAWAKVIISPPKTDNGQPFPRSSWGTAVGMLIKNPTPENVKLFDDSKFGRAGFRAKEIIDQLAPKAAPNTEEKPAEPSKPKTVFDEPLPGAGGLVRDALRHVLPQKAQDYISDKVTGAQPHE